MKKRITLILINDEKKNSRILSAKSCTIDTANCAGGAVDTCIGMDIAGCYGTSAIDYCKYLDAAACMYGSRDYCDYDHQACYNGASDSCVTDN